jgi:hypothetical protein
MAADPIRLPALGLPTGTCPVCGAVVGEVRLAGRWDDRDRGFGAWYSGRCAARDVDFTLTVERAISGEWRIDAPDPDRLIAVLTEGEIVAVSNNLSRYKVHGPKWESFLARRRPGDEVWNFSTEEGIAGVALVRDGRPLARFFLNRLI